MRRSTFSLLPPFLSLSLSLSFFLSFSIHDIYIGARGTPERGKFGCNNPKLLSCRLSVDPHFSKYLQSSPDPSRPFKGFRGLTRVKGKINKPAQKPGSLSFSLSLFFLSIFVLNALAYASIPIPAYLTYRAACASVWRAWRHLADCQEIDQENWTNGGTSHKRLFFCYRKTHFTMIFFGVAQKNVVIRCIYAYRDYFRIFTSKTTFVFIRRKQVCNIFLIIRWTSFTVNREFTYMIL